MWHSTSTGFQQCQEQKDKVPQEHGYGLSFSVSNRDYTVSIFLILFVSHFLTQYLHLPLLSLILSVLPRGPFLLLAQSCIFSSSNECSVMAFTTAFLVGVGHGQFIVESSQQRAGSCGNKTETKKKFENTLTQHHNNKTLKVIDLAVRKLL